MYKMVVALAMALALPLFAEAQVQPKVTKLQAEQAVLTAVKGGKILSCEYESEGGRRIWSVDVRLDGNIREVWVDPVSGHVIKVQKESMAHEKSEMSGEKKMMPKTHVSHARKPAMTQVVTRTMAGEIALKAVHGGVVLSVQKIASGKVQVWSVNVKTSKGTEDVLVSPQNGKVLKISTVAKKAAMQQK